MSKLKDLEDKIKGAVDNSCVSLYSNDLREHLGASLIGRDCYRFLQMHFRWAYKPNYGDLSNTARRLRIFNHGHLTEPRFIEWLKYAKIPIRTHDENNKQFRFSAVNGHFGGSCDGFIFDNSLGIGLLEFKSNCTGSGFNKVKLEPLHISKPDHWAQICTYSSDKAFNTNYFAYLNLNKNDDDIAIVCEETDKSYGNSLIDKAEIIINADEPLPKISKNSKSFMCKMCDANSVCWGNSEPEKNCRSCKKSIPVADAFWKCSKFDMLIPPDRIGEEYDCWEYFFK